MKPVLLALLIAAVAAGAVRAAPELAALQAKAQTGDADAEFALAEAYRAGKGVGADAENAIMWYRRAANHGHIRASEELGFALFAHGDRREAMPYIEKAAARGEARAFYLLGTAHFNGDYASRDWPLGYAQMSRAASAGLPAAVRNLEQMGRYLLPGDRAKADLILATLPPVRTLRAADAAAPPSADRAAPAVAPARRADVTPLAKSPKKSGPMTAAPAGGVWKVQLGAYGTADRARDRWRALSARVSRLGAYSQNVVAAGSVQRLQAGNIASRTDAQALCSDVRAAGGDCLVIAP